MSKKNGNVERKLSADDMLQVALDLMERLTAAPGNTVDGEDIARDLGISIEQMREVVEMLQGLADEHTGSHIALDLAGGDITLSGDAGRLEPVRLTPAESLALRRALTHCSIAEDVRARAESALCSDTEDGGGARLMGGDRLLGAFYPIISEAIAIGARLEISYRAGGESEPHTRLVDPKLIEVSGDTAYLIAWNVEKDVQRSYRLDRMASVSLTEDSVEQHDFTPYSAATSIRANGSTAVLRFADRGTLDLRGWEGLHRDEISELEDGRIVVPMSFTSLPWLFSQVAAAAGAIEIIEPTALRSEFKTWSHTIA